MCFDVPGVNGVQRLPADLQACVDLSSFLPLKLAAGCGLAVARLDFSEQVSYPVPLARWLALLPLSGTNKVHSDRVFVLHCKIRAGMCNLLLVTPVSGILLLKWSGSSVPGRPPAGPRGIFIPSWNIPCQGSYGRRFWDGCFRLNCRLPSVGTLELCFDTALLSVCTVEVNKDQTTSGCGVNVLSALALPYWKHVSQGWPTFTATVSTQNWSAQMCVHSMRGGVHVNCMWNVLSVFSRTISDLDLQRVCK